MLDEEGAVMTTTLDGVTKKKAAEPSAEQQAAATASTGESCDEVFPSSIVAMPATEEIFGSRNELGVVEFRLNAVALEEVFEDQLPWCFIALRGDGHRVDRDQGFQKLCKLRLEFFEGFGGARFFP